VKPPPFEYHDPETLEEAIDLLVRYGGEARALAGGQSLIPLLNFRLARPAALVDLNRIPGLDGISRENGWLVTGSMTRQRRAERSATVARACPLLVEALCLVGHVQIRNRGTLGGSLAHADPAAELAAVATCLDAELVVAGPAGERRLPAGEFFVTYFTTVLEPAEILTGIRWPALEPGEGWAFIELARRHGDFALAGVACRLALTAPGGKIARASLALCGVGDRPVRAGAAEAMLVGEQPGAELYRAAAAAVREAVEPDSDVHASAAYRRHLAGVLAERALALAVSRASGGGAAGASAGGPAATGREGGGS